MIGVVDMEILNGDPFWHIAGIAEIMLTGIRSTYQGSAGWSAACWDKDAVADNKLSLPGTAVVRA